MATVGELNAVPGARRLSPAHAAVIPLRRGSRAPRWSLPRLGRLAPSTRSLVVGCAVVAGAIGAYAAARETSMFAIRTVEIRGATPATAAAVRKALAPLDGTSMLALGPDAVRRRAEALPSVVSATYDRAFPHTLRVTIREERPVAVLRSGPDSFLISARGRVLRRLEPRARLELPRIWVARATDVTIGATLSGDSGSAVAALAPLRRLRFPEQVLSATAVHGQLALRLRGGLEVRLGGAGDLRLKLSVAGQIVKSMPPASAAYLDVSVPERPVAGGPNLQVAG